jgi:hypothetical protein
VDCRRHRLLAGSQDCLSFLQMQCDVLSHHPTVVLHTMAHGLLVSLVVL